MAQTSSSDNSSMAAGEAKGLGGGAIATLTGIGLLAIVVIQNTERVSIDFLFWSFTWPLWLFTLTVAVLGSILWIGLGVLRRHRRRVARRDARDG